MDLKRGKADKKAEDHLAQPTAHEPVPVNLRKDELIGRLYEQGFSHYTMASINRPLTNNSHAKPLTSNLYSLKNNLTKEKKQRQTSILFNVPEQSYLNPQEELMIKSKHSAFMHTTSQGFFKGPKLHEAERIDPRDAIDIRDSGRQPKALPPIGSPAANFNKTSTSKFTIRGGSHGVNRATTGKQQGSALVFAGHKGETKDLEQSLPNFEATGFGFNQGVGMTQQPFSVTANSFYKTGMGSMAGAYPEFDQEMRNSKLVVDKLRGKVDQDKARAVKKLPPIEEYQRRAQEEKEQKELEADKLAQERLDAKKDNRETTDLDMYLGIILKNNNNSNIDEFMYAVPDPKSENPYKLKLTDYKKEKLAENYTVSGKGLCHYKNNQPVEFIPLKDWLDERETFKKIQSLQFFQKFRKWKTLKRWKKTCQQFKRAKYKKDLQQALFISDPNLRKALFAHREISFNMSMLKFINLGSQHEQTDPMSLSNFTEQQLIERQRTKMDIERASKESRICIAKGFSDCLEGVKTANKTEANKGPGGGNRANPKSTHRITETAYDQLGFSKEMSYDQRSKVRNVCMTFLRFSFLVDFIALDALTKIYLNSVSELRDRFEALSNQEAAKPLTDVEKARANYGGRVPMFEVHVQFIGEYPRRKAGNERSDDGLLRTCLNCRRPQLTSSPSSMHWPTPS